ncbi:hypothetical protein [Streptomyces scopuliridis]|uniref:hypothetical protein n=1 Tax=Streptomyces scopuliridis TaxID=452529 RepID=UPI0035D6F2E1
MSDDDQQYRYGQGQGQRQGHGQGHGQGPYGDQAPYDQYGRPQQPSYGVNGANGAYQDPRGSQGWAEPQYRPQSPAQQEPAAQTWEGQTWDTQYQPHVQSQGRPGQYYPAQGQAPAQAHAYQPQQAAAAADTAYLPPQAAYPLPPEVPSNVPPEVPSPAPSPYAPQAPAATPFTASPGSADGYSAPTTMGNARITDAQRARAEGRSPIIPPGIQPAGLTALLGLLLAGGAAIGPYALLVPLVLLQAVTAAGWFRLNGMWPARQGIALAFLGGITADIAVLAAGRENAPAAIIGTLGVWVLLVVVLQLRSRASADERMTGLMATVASAALAILATGQLAAVPDAVVVGGLAVAAATVARALPLPGAVSVVVALLAGAGAGIAAGGMTDLGSPGALLGLGAGVCALVGLRAASYDYPSRFVHMTAGVALPLTAAAPAVYLLGRMLA